MKTELVERVLHTLLSLEDFGSTKEGDTLEEKCLTKMIYANVFERKTSEWEYPARESLKERLWKRDLLKAKDGGNICFRKTLETVPDKPVGLPCATTLPLEWYGAWFEIHGSKTGSP